jgi:transposase
MSKQGRALQRQQRRLEAVRLLEQGWSPVSIAARFGVTDRAVRNWRDRYQADGTEGLADRPRRGKACKLSARQRQGLRKRLLKGARSEGFDTDLWTCPRVKDVIRRRYGVEYHVDALPYVLKSLGFTCQKPQLKAVERDDAAIATWIAKDWPRIKKSRAPASSARIRR